MPGDLTPDAAGHHCSVGLLPKSQSAAGGGAFTVRFIRALSRSSHRESSPSAFHCLQKPCALAEPQACPLFFKHAPHLWPSPEPAASLDHLLPPLATCSEYSRPRGARSSLGASPERDSQAHLILPRPWALRRWVGPPSPGLCYHPSPPGVSQGVGWRGGL